MSTHLKEKQETILQILNALAEESAKGTPIIVEGIKDVEALRNLAIDGPIIQAKTSGKSFLQVIEELERAAVTEVILLLDFDKRGKQGIKTLKQYLEHTKIRPNIIFWQNLSAVLKKDLQCIEGLQTYMETLQTKILKQLIGVKSMINQKLAYSIWRLEGN